MKIFIFSSLLKEGSECFDALSTSGRFSVNSTAMPFALRLSKGERWIFQKPVVQIMALALVLGGLLAASPVHAAADAAPRISVIFVEPDKFTDVRYSEAERGSRAILLQVQRFIIDTAARYLPEPLRLEVKITDIDLAGDFELFRGPQSDQARVNKSIYPPRIALEFRVSDASEQTVKEGQRNLTDLNYQLRVDYPREDYLRYEKELLRDWLRDELASLKSGKTH